MTEEEVTAVLQSLGQPRYRGKQVFSQLHQGKEFGAMTNLPEALRNQLRESYEDQPVTIRKAYRSQLDGTVKFLYALPDDHIIEGVLMHYKYGYTLCVSTQVGCRMGCAFCASTLAGCARNLTSGEMLGQVLSANAWLAAHTERNARVGNIVLMGSGEPFDNYDEVVRFLRLLRDPDGIRIGMRSVSLSTCGLVPELRRFAEEGLPVTLSVSLHAPNDQIRQTIMPIARRYPVHDVMSAAKAYILKTGRRVIIEYALIHDKNASVQHAKELALLLRGGQFHVNVIPLNSVPERGLQGASEKEIRLFMQALEDASISVTRRREMGDDINGACGQLRRDFLSGRFQQS